MLPAKVNPATAGVPLANVSVPPLLLYVVDPPTQSVGPVMVAGRGFTVTCLVVKHPVEVKVNVIFAVPAILPTTIPLASTVATAALLELQVPPVDVVASVVVELSQKLAIPVMPAGFGLMETVTLPSGPQQPPAD